ncbi:ImmA/IrrE family metallo-endopeptidase, partial [Bilophila wadsworthia]
NFTIAHELGHYFLHQQDPFNATGCPCCRGGCRG